MLVVVGLIVAFIIMLIVVKPGTRNCRWRADHRRDGPEGQFYHCVACGAQTYTSGKPPGECLQNRT